LSEDRPQDMNLQLRPKLGTRRGSIVVSN
jgi:hypothetical protein